MCLHLKVSQKAAVMVLAGLLSHEKAQLGKDLCTNPLTGKTGVLAGFLRASAPGWLLAEGLPGFLPCAVCIAAAR